MSNRIAKRLMEKKLRRDSEQFPLHLVRISEAAWPAHYRPPRILEVWRSRDFLVQVFHAGAGITRLSVCRAALNTAGTRWADGIGWDDLQRLKSECGRGHLDAAEAYPADESVVNVANMRHLFVFDEPLNWIWRKPEFAE